ncbi:hypothetical protein FZW96_21580 [Bacillus sp. BGMRC 2118]|nr:hypothetical protein FZW96_21580 [Bacillus sp. BGMRC 2118]
MNNRMIKFFRTSRHRNWSSLLAFITVWLSTELINLSYGNTFITLIVLFVIYAMIYIISEALFALFLGKKNKEVSSFWPFALAAAIVATVNTFVF